MTITALRSREDAEDYLILLLDAVMEDILGASPEQGVHLILFILGLWLAFAGLRVLWWSRSAAPSFAPVHLAFKVLSWATSRERTPRPLPANVVPFRRRVR